MVIGACSGGRLMTVNLCSTRILLVKLVVEKALEAGPWWCSAKP